MPHINRIRVNNIKYNFGTQFYDDFVMRFDGRNALYDLANGGGKSVLLLLLLQNLIPNCALDDKQPVEKLFRTGDGSTTIHSLIEWKLDDYLIEDDYRYMLTGFCARKARSESEEETAGKDTAAIEYFNYVIFYRSYNENDLVNLPLSQGRQRITYAGLKNYLKGLERKDYSLKVQIFERKGEYQRFISRYGLYESEWEIIRGINKTEGHVRTYFETSYRTTRKVVEDLLIEEIIQKAFRMRTGDNGTDLMADTLYNMKDQMVMLAGKRADIANYDHQKEVLESFSGRIGTMSTMYQDESLMNLELVKLHHLAALTAGEKSKALELAEKEKENALKKSGDLKRRLDTVRIQSSQERLQTLVQAEAVLREEIHQLSGSLAVSRDALNMKESINDYLEYLADKGRFEMVKAEADNAQSTEQELLEKLRSYAAACRRYAEKRAQLLQGQIAKQRAQIEADEKQLAVLSEGERETDKQVAVLAHQADELQRLHNELQQEFGRERQESGLLLIENIDKLLRETMQKSSVCQDRLTAVSDEMAVSEEEIRSCTLLIEAVIPKIEELEKNISGHEAFLQAYKEAGEKIDRLAKVYRASDVHMLQRVLAEQYRKNVYEEGTAGAREQQLENRAAALKNGTYLVMPEETEQVINYIRSHFEGACIYGADYIKELSGADKEKLLVRLPFLPYAVIVSGRFTSVISDEAFRMQDFGGHPVPVIGLETVLSEHTPVSDQVFFAARGAEFYADEQFGLHQLETVENELDAVCRKRSRLKEQQQILEADMKQFDQFMLVYEQSAAARREALQTAVSEKNALLAEKSEAVEKIPVLRQHMHMLEQTKADIEEILSETKNRIESLKHLSILDRQMTENEAAAKENNEHQAESTQQLLSLRNDLEFCRRRLQEEKTVCQNAVGELEALHQQQSNCWQAYDDGRETGAAEIPEEEALSAFMGIRQVYEQKHTDMADKRLLMDNYEKSMARALKAIENRNITMAQMVQLQKEGRLIAAAETQLIQCRGEIGEQLDQLERANSRLEILSAEKNKLSGSVSQAVSVIEERYGQYRQVSLNNHTCEEYIAGVTAMLEAEEQKYQQAKQQSEQLTRMTYYLEAVRKDVDRTMQLYGLTGELTAEVLPKDTNLRRKYEEITRRYEQLRAENYEKRQLFEKDRNKAVEALRQLNAEELASEIYDHVTMPQNPEEAAALMRRIGETADIIDAEKARVAKNIEAMAAVRDNFENECLQICMNIRNELEKLPKMSRIAVEGQMIQMVGLKIPYIKEVYYKQQMAAYIDDIVKQADDIRSAEEMMRFIRSQLSWKKLFAVIVTDMNAIRLNLYKRERIREQSRYLRYEEAVGSTGQSQGIYIQFLIAIIHYISCIHAGTGENDALKKVIFIDNPFGAARDIYIWEPIFALLKANHVQLVVPARGATPAISGKFDVNYVLGQRMAGKRQQTVVVDYHSNIHIEEMTYTPIEYEQEVFDFI